MPSTPMISPPCSRTALVDTDVYTYSAAHDDSRYRLVVSPRARLRLVQPALSKPTSTFRLAIRLAKAHTQASPVRATTGTDG
jgi:hypothetical protein